MPDEEFHVNDRIKVYVLEVNRAQQAARRSWSPARIQGWSSACLSWKCPRSRPALCRSSPSRARRATAPRWPCIPPIRRSIAVGACVGPARHPRGKHRQRAARRKDRYHQMVVRPGANTSPTRLIPRAVDQCVHQRRAKRPPSVVVPDNQLSLAIGKEGQNARLAAKLTGWKIDIKSQSQMEESMGV